MKNTIDFEIFTRGAADKLIIVDASEYFEKPSNVIAEIVFPDFKDPYNAYLNAKSVTVLTTKSLGFTTEKCDFPDGLYTIRFSVSPNATEFLCKNYMKLDQISSKMCELLNKECPDKKDLEKMYTIDQLLVAARCMENCNPKKATEFFKEAVKKLDKEVGANKCQV